ncbi:MAG: BadF/BadG/BcrA/BcrD ATPase family protein [Acholeplasmataceae bacterium]
MALYLGIDGSMTKTKVSLMNEKEKIVYQQTSGPSSMDSVNMDKTKQAFFEALDPYFSNHPTDKIDAAFIGLGGIIFPTDSYKIETLLRELPFFKENALIVAKNDMENALYSGGCFEEGISLMCGTAMVAFGKDIHKSHKAAGWGYKEGELGSSYHLGTEAIRYAIRAFDGRYPKDDFSIEIAKSIGLEKPSDIVSIMEDYSNDRTKTASLAPIVTMFANKNNEYAKRIIDLATSECALAVKAVHEHIHIKNKTIVIVGSLGNVNGYYKDELHKKIKEIDPYFNIIKPIMDSADAAALMAKKLNS